MEELFVGTSGWSYKSWVGPFYPPGTQAGDYLRRYAARFGTVEIDSTFYRIPPLRMIEGWDAATPPGFRFAPKFAQVITHEKRLRDCDAELKLFLDRIGRLGEKLGPLLLQFDYTFQWPERDILVAFLDRLPKESRYTVEVRHRSWLREEFFDLLAARRVALVLHDLYYMPKLSRVTTDFTYIRLLGKRSEVPDDFSKVVRDRTEELDAWGDRIRGFLESGITVFAYANNRYQGHGPATALSLLDRVRRFCA